MNTIKQWAIGEPMTTYRRHNCASLHRTWATLAKCVWPRAYWIQGDGPYASVAHCRVLTIVLAQTAQGAQNAKALIDDMGCGGWCTARHEVVRLAIPRARNPHNH